MFSSILGIIIIIIIIITRQQQQQQLALVRNKVAVSQL